MSPTAQQPQMNLVQTPDYRESYANSVQIRVSVWDFQLVFGLASSESPDQITIRNQNAIFLSPQQAKALWNMLGQNLAQYEQAFGDAQPGAAEPQLPAGSDQLGSDRLRWKDLMPHAAGAHPSRLDNFPGGLCGALPEPLHPARACPTTGTRPATTFPRPGTSSAPAR